MTSVGNKLTSCKVYLLTNKVNGKIYVGQSWLEPLSKRMGRDGCNYNNSICLYYAIQKYGCENFEYTILEEIMPKDASEEANQEVQDKINQLEDEYIIKYDSRNLEIGYNLKAGGRGGKHSEESKKKISESLKGDKSPWFGKHLSDEAKRKISEANTGNIKSQEEKDHHSEKMIEWHKNTIHPMLGKKHPPEVLEKISKALVGRVIPREVVEAAALKRIKISKEKEQEIIADYIAGMPACEIMEKHNYNHVYRVLHRNNIALAGCNRNDRTGKTHSQESIDKMKASQKEVWAKRKMV
jgi:group I intron endonuclease